MNGSCAPPTQQIRLSTVLPWSRRGHLLAVDLTGNDRERAHPSLVSVDYLLIAAQVEAVTSGFGPKRTSATRIRFWSKGDRPSSTFVHRRGNVRRLRAMEAL